MFALLLTVQTTYAGFGDEWVRKHALSIGVDFAFTKGDLDRISEVYSKGNLVPDTNAVPDMPFLLVYAFDLRALADAHSVAFNFGIGFPEDIRYLRLGLEYQYHFLWPEPFRIGAGIGYTFSSIETSDALLTGNAPHAVLSAHYYFTENWAIECAFRYRLLHMNKIATDENPKASVLNKAIMQNMGELGLRGMFVF